MKKINLNLVAKLVSDIEGGKVQTNIAQIKEVIKCYNQVLAENYTMCSIVELFTRVGV